MKRNNGGYVLVYVVVVIVILCILVPAACSNSLQNLKAQQASIERMQQLYAAEGQIEQFVAEVEDQAVKLKNNSGVSKVGDSDAAKVDVNAKIKNAFDEAAKVPKQTFKFELEDENWPQPIPIHEPFWLKYKLQVNAKVENITVQSNIIANWYVQIDVVSQDNENGQTYDVYSYEITDCTITYESYDISATTEGKGEDQS